MEPTGVKTSKHYYFYRLGFLETKNYLEIPNGDRCQKFKFPLKNNGPRVSDVCFMYVEWIIFDRFKRVRFIMGVEQSILLSEMVSSNYILIRNVFI